MPEGPEFIWKINALLTSDVIRRKLLPENKYRNPDINIRKIMNRKPFKLTLL